MNRDTFGKKDPIGQRPRVDRFIQPRSSINECRYRRSLLTSWNKADSQTYWCQKYLLKKKYAKFLYTSTLSTDYPDHWFEDAHRTPDWPCIPRGQSYLTSADSVLDLPQYRSALFPELLDWSRDDVLLAALGKSYYKWSWSKQSLIRRGYTQNQIFTCKFDPTGELIALGTDSKCVEVHHTAITKLVVGSYCKCETLTDSQCAITAIDWSPTGNSFLTGCSKGALMAFSRDADLIDWQHGFRSAVYMIRISPDARFAAVLSVAEEFVAVLTWPSLKPHTVLKAEWTLTTYAWHPWRSALLALGGLTTDTKETAISLWDAPSDHLRESFITPARYSIDAMLFSHRTGEMVLSLWNVDHQSDRRGPPGWCGKLVVLSDLETVVDEWGNEKEKQLQRVRTMVFSPDDSKLATATFGEDLVIWNFLPEEKVSKKKISRKKRRFSALPVYLDETVHGFSLR